MVAFDNGARIAHFDLSPTLLASLQSIRIEQPNRSRFFPRSAVQSNVMIVFDGPLDACDCPQRSVEHWSGLELTTFD